MSQTRKPVRQMRVELSAHSSLYSHVYTTNAALTFFKNDLSDPTVAELHRIDEKEVHPSLFHCVHLAMNGYRSDANHDQFHQDESDFEAIHTHILKLTDDRAYYDHITPKELDCYLNVFRSVQLKHELCQENRTECIIDDEGIRLLKDEYNAYYQRTVNQATPKTPTGYDSLFLGKAFMRTCKQGMVNGFVNTMLDYYFMPLLMNHGVKSFMMRHAIKAALVAPIYLALFGSMVALPTTVIIEMTNAYLEKHHRNVMLLPLMRHFLYFVNVFSLNRAEILNLPLATFASVGSQCAGHEMAMQLISFLPKLKAEPEPQISEGAQQPNHAMLYGQNASGLRRRSPSPRGNPVPGR